MPAAEFPERRFPPPWSVQEFGSLLYRDRQRRAEIGIRPRQRVTIVKSSGLRNSAVTPGSLAELPEIDGVGS